MPWNQPGPSPRRTLAGRLALAIGAVTAGCAATGALVPAGAQTAPASSSPTTIGTTPLAPTTTVPPSGPASWPALRAGESYGIDVSSYQGQVAWPAAAQNGVSFAYIKATEGATYTNPYFAADWQGAKSAGIAYGAYHFFSLCSSGKAQAESFLTMVPSDPSALPPAVDLELQGNCTRRPKTAIVARQLGTFVSEVEKATKRRMIFYVGWDFAEWYRKLTLLRGHPLWLDDGPMPDGRTVVIWQSPDPARIGGIGSGVDLDIARLGALRAR